MRDYVEWVMDNDGEGLYLIGWYELEEVIIVEWVKKSYYFRVVLKYCVLEFVLFIMLVVFGFGMVYFVCNFGD